MFRITLSFLVLVISLTVTSLGVLADDGGPSSPCRNWNASACSVTDPFVTAIGTGCSIQYAYTACDGTPVSGATAIPIQSHQTQCMCMCQPDGYIRAFFDTRTNTNVQLGYTCTGCGSGGSGGGGGTCYASISPYCGPGATWTGSSCCYTSPILMDVDGDGFNLTDYYDGVQFDFGGDGELDQISWTAAGSDDSWLVLDRNGNEKIDNATEMFGNLTPQLESDHPNGFFALAEYDMPGRGGDNDGRISPRDAIYDHLKLWCDRNHNGISEPDELTTLRSHGIAIIRLDYRESRRTDRHGNRFAYRARIVDVSGAQAGRWAWDVFLGTNPAPTSP
jgi:hypothetical protein